MSREYTNKLVAMIDEEDPTEDEFVSVVWMSPEGVKLRSVPETDACEGCYYDGDAGVICSRNTLSCSGIIWVESTEN